MCKRCDELHSFKPGDQIQCIDGISGEWSSVETGLVYTVKEQVGQTLTLRGLADNQYFDSKRFIAWILFGSNRGRTE